MTFEQCIVVALAIFGCGAILSGISRMRHYSRMRMSNGEPSVSDDSLFCAETTRHSDAAMFGNAAGASLPERGPCSCAPGNEAERAKLEAILTRGRDRRAMSIRRALGEPLAEMEMVSTKAKWPLNASLPAQAPKSQMPFHASRPV